MKTVSIGRSGLTAVNAPLGAMWLGTKQNRDESFALFDHYVARGGNFIDTANIYAHWLGDPWKGGESETVLGEWMKARGNRAGLVVSTKVGHAYPGTERTLDPKVIHDECDRSLRRLQTDHIDIYFAHVDDLTTPPEATLEAFAGLIKAGKVRAIGASNFTTGRLAAINAMAVATGLPRYEILQPRYTYLRPRHDAQFGAQLSLTAEMDDYCRGNEISIMPFSSGLGGAYNARPDRPLPAQYASADSTARLAVLRAVASELSTTPHQIVFAWLAAKGTLPLIAGSTNAQLDESLDALDQPLTADQLYRLDAAGE
jgi:aryl-alcohol dehydrogenase-like predicted oxidoreductase